MKKNKKQLFRALLALWVSLAALSCASLGGEAFAWEDDPDFTPPDTVSASSGGVPAALKVSASGTYETREDFEKAAVSGAKISGSVFSLTSNPSGGGSAEIVMVEDGGSKALKMTHTGPVTGGRTQLSYKPQGEVVSAVGVQKKVEIEFRFKIEGTNGTVSMPYIFYASAPSNAGLTASYNAGNSRFQVYNGGQQTAKDNVAKGEWHRFRALLDYASSTFEVSVDGEEVISGASFRQDAQTKDFGEIRFYLANVSDGGAVSLYLDDLTINAGL
ncbi:MAG: hypothetical protein LBJ90_01000 [Treponema sp.]|nr:hypothetical protein [Treponema sp.]